MEELLALLPLLEGIKTEDIVPRRTAVTEAGGDTFVPKGSVETVLENVKQNAVNKLLGSIGLVTDPGISGRNVDISKPRMPSVGDYTVKELKIPEGARVEEVGKGINKYDVLVGEDAPTWGIHGLVDFFTGGNTDWDKRGRRRGGKIVPHPVTGYGAKAPEETEEFDSEAYQAATNAYNNEILTGNPLGDLVDTLNVLQSAGVTQANVNREQLVRDAALQQEILKNQLQQTGDFNLAYGQELANLPMTRAKLQQTAANIAETQAKATAALADSASPRNLLYDPRKFVG
tara:strand:+ start:4275 stop:5138 length:864 start_codon:yes stop_codon:yes gene_type:complete